MMANDKASSSGLAANPRGRRLKIIGVVLWLSGLGSAGLVYWHGTRAAGLMDDPAMLGYNRSAHRQMGLMFGGMGSMIDDVTDDLKQPGNQAFLIVAASTILAAGCFYFSQPLMPSSPTPGDRPADSEGGEPRR